MPRYIVIENLDIRGARPPNTFTDATAPPRATRTTRRRSTSRRASTSRSAAASCTTAATASSSPRATSRASRDILVEANYIYDNGNVGSIFEHNNYTEAIGITFQFNRFGPLRAGARRQQPQGPLGRPRRPLQLDRGRQPAARPGRRRGQRAHQDAPALPHRRSSTATCSSSPTAPATARSSTTAATAATTAELPQGHAVFLSTTRSSRTRTDNTTLFRLSTNDERADVQEQRRRTRPRRVTPCRSSTTPACSI